LSDKILEKIGWSARQLTHPQKKSLNELVAFIEPLLKQKNKSIDKAKERKFYDLFFNLLNSGLTKEESKKLIGIER